MIQKEKFQKISDFIKKHCTADDFSINMFSSENLTTRFAQNGITQHLKGDNLRMRLEVAFDNKTGAAVCNSLEKDALLRSIQKAESLAKLNKPDPEFIPTEPAHDLPKTDSASENTAQITTEMMVDDIRKCVKNAEQKKAKVSGLSEKTLYNHFLATKNGFVGYYDVSSFSHSMTLKKGKVETKIAHSVQDRERFKMEDLIAKLNQQFDSLKDPEKIEPKKLPVILRPEAVATWLFYLVWVFDRREADEGVSPFAEKIGKEFFGKNFTFRSSIKEENIFSPPFIMSGIPTDDIEWIKNGVIKNMRMSRYYAKKINETAIYPYNIIIDGGNATEAEMMQKVKRGVIVNNLWYIRPVDQKRGEWTGLTRDGVLYFEDGKIIKSVNNFRWNEILHEATRRILALGKSEQKEYYLKVPTMLIDDFNFVDVTTF